MSARDALQAAQPITRTKRFETLRARFALVGGCLWLVHDDHGRPAYVMSRGAVTVEASSLDAVEALLDEAGA